jgi:uncharacterized BrkB/YihY/UPF0761 family membrane protein
VAVFSQFSSPASLRGSVRSYAGDLRGWIGGLTVRYAIAAVLLLSAGASIIAAIGVAIAALFRWLEVSYGANDAYAIVIGLLLFLGIVCAVIAVILLKRALPPVPRPGRQAKAVGRSVAADAMLAASVPHKALVKADPLTEVMVGLAAACLVGWLVSSRMGRSRKARGP